MTHSQRTIILAAVVLSAAVCFGQAPPPPPPPGAVGRIISDRVSFEGKEFSFEGRIVKGQPYTADAVTETTQTLGDGNHISRKETSSVARDSEGRTRREQPLNGLGPWAAAPSSTPQKIVFINDPVARVNYVLEPDHTARKMTDPPAGSGQNFVYTKMKAEIATTQAVRTGVFTLAIPGPDSGKNSKTEQLGSQMIEGVQAEGTRTTTTIPAGQIGNELPIEIVSERWYSPELQTTIMTKSSDPRMGETVFRLTNIQRTEPPASLFAAPPDYKIEEPELKESN